VNHWKTGLSSAVPLRAFLRQDTDIILVDEIYFDPKITRLAIRAANEGRLVISTLHWDMGYEAHAARPALAFLLGMGLPPFEIANSVKLIITQQLCRRLCYRCKVEQEIPEAVLLAEGFKKEQIPELKLYGPSRGGCEECAYSGYRGRIGLYQVMPISEQMKRLMMERKYADELVEQAHSEGIPNLRESGQKKVTDGITSLEELNRVVHKD